MNEITARRERLEMPPGLEHPDVLGPVLTKLGLRLKPHTVGVSLHHGGASVTVEKFSVSEVNNALGRFEVPTADRMALRLVLARYGLLAGG